MAWLHNFQRDSIQSPSPSPSSSSSSSSLLSSSSGKTSPAIVFLVVIVAIVIIFCGLLQLLVGFITKNRPSFLASHSNNQYPEMTGSDTFQTQLQQLFELHDSGLDQALIDALPVFHYKEIMGLKEPFDCAVCLCEFSEQDKFRLIPRCGHAFHIDCIDTWLLSNSTCPLCRLALAVENPPSELQDSSEEGGVGGTAITTTVTTGGEKPNELEIVGQKRVVFPVRLGKFRNTDDEKGEAGIASTSTSSSCINLGARRCYSMGSYQYVVADSVLQVALSSETSANAGDLIVKERGRQWQNGNSSVDSDTDMEGKRISVASKNESLSISKIWLWSKKGKFLGSSNTHVDDTSTVDMDLPWINVV